MYANLDHFPLEFDLIVIHVGNVQIVLLFLKRENVTTNMSSKKSKL
jgi:hypothetical protein